MTPAHQHRFTIPTAVEELDPPEPDAADDAGAPDEPDLRSAVAHRSPAAVEGDARAGR